MIENFKLHVFRVVADTLNFSKAADELHLSQPAVTSQVRSLEEGLGIALFDRVGRNATLTPAGKTLLPFVRQIETLTRDAIAALAPFGVQEGVELNIGASHTVGVYLLPKLLPALVREWPRLRIHIVSGSTTEILNALATHQVSIGLIEAPAHRPDLKIEVFMEDELCLVLPPCHRWAKKATLRAAEIVQEPILLRETGSEMRRFVEEYLERNGGAQSTTAHKHRYEFDGPSRSTSSRQSIYQKEGPEAIQSFQKGPMSVLLFTTLIFVTSLFAGLLGALTGLGGGVVIVPALVLLFKVDLRYAIGASLVSVIATSSGAAAAYVSLTGRI